jgi:hypothetical protein
MYVEHLWPVLMVEVAFLWIPAPNWWQLCGRDAIFTSALCDITSVKGAWSIIIVPFQPMGRFLRFQIRYLRKQLMELKNWLWNTVMYIGNIFYIWRGLMVQRCSVWPCYFKPFWSINRYQSYREVSQQDILNYVSPSWSKTGAMP